MTALPIDGIPDRDVEPPSVVRSLAGGRPLRCVWHNEVGGLTFEIGGAERRFVKWVPPASGLDLTAELPRLRWAARYIPAPAVLDHGRDGAGEWLVTAALPGVNAVDERWHADPEPAVRAVGAGLRALHDTLPTAECPFSWSVADRLAAAGLPGSALGDPPPIDRLVVCHGDPCMPNTLLDNDGRCCGYVDLGSLGLADRWADIAVAGRSADSNYGPGWQTTLLDAYGIAPDPARIEYYRRLWDLT